MIDTLESLHTIIERGSTTLDERTFLNSYNNNLMQAHECILSFQRTTDRDELRQAWNLYLPVYKLLCDQLPHITSLDLDHVSPREYR